MNYHKGLLAELAEATRLQEGAEGIRRVLRSIYREGPVPIRDLARDLGIPVPVVAAVRGELEKRGLAVRDVGVALTDEGITALQASAGIASRESFTLNGVFDLPDALWPLVDRFRAIASERPEADVTLDQSHATPETAIRRAAYLFEHDAIEGRSIIFLGDDDLTSIAVGLLSEHLGVRPERLVVCDVDDRLTRFIEQTAGDTVPVEVVHHNLRNPLDKNLVGAFDAFFTDPPYTIPGLDLFCKRGVAALGQEVGKMGFASFGHKGPQDTVGIGATLSGRQLAVIEIIPDFNRYDGAQLLAGSSQMIRVVSAGSSTVSGDVYSGPLYTRDMRKRRG